MGKKTKQGKNLIGKCGAKRNRWEQAQTPIVQEEDPSREDIRKRPSPFDAAPFFG